MFNFTLCVCRKFSWWTLMCQLVLVLSHSTHDYIFRKSQHLSWLSTYVVCNITRNQVGWGRIHKTNWIIEQTPSSHVCLKVVCKKGGHIFCNSSWPLLSVYTQPSLALSQPSSEFDLNIVTHWLKMKFLFVLLDKTAPMLEKMNTWWQVWTKLLVCS